MKIKNIFQSSKAQTSYYHVNHSVNRFIKLSSSKLRVDPTQFNFLKNAVTFFIFLGAIIFIFYSIPKLKTLSLTLFAGAGILTAIALFASQAAFANIVSGIF